MGFLRLLLALIVVVHHIPGYVHNNPSFPILLTSIDGMVAVLVFYIFSGFYMSLVINQKYRMARNHPVSFYANRVLRIFPLYWLVLLLYFTYEILTGRGGNVSNIGKLHDVSWFFQVFMNLTTFGLDLAPSLGGYTFQLIGPAWSLGSELLFYIFAPWLVRFSFRRTVALVLVIFAIRLVLYDLGYDRYPLRVLFFPLSLGFFMLGHLSFLLLTRIESSKFASSIMTYQLGIIAMTLVLAAGYVLNVGGGIDPDRLNLWIFYVVVTVLIPVIFANLRHSRIDKFLGDMTFPLYISHTLVLHFVSDFVVGTQNSVRIIALSFAVLFALLLTLAIELPVERLRGAFGAWILRVPKATRPTDVVATR